MDDLPLGSKPAFADDNDIAYCFRLLLQRRPSAEEWKGHKALAGSSLAAVIRCYTDSPEFAHVAGRKPTHSAREVAFPQFRILVSDDDLAVGVHVASGNYESQVAEVFNQHIRPGMTVMDLGANIGYFTMLAASLVGPSGHVVAVEPNLGNVRLLEASRNLNRFDNVRVVPCALSAEAGMLSLQTAYSNGVTAPLAAGSLDALHDLHIVPCIPLTALLPLGKKVDFIKIDVEGAEYAALSNCPRLFQFDRPVIVSEFSPALLASNSEVDPKAYLRLFTTHGYSMSVIGHSSVSDEGSSVQDVMAVFEGAVGDHVDILFRP